MMTSIDLAAYKAEGLSLHGVGLHRETGIYASHQSRALL